MRHRPMFFDRRITAAAIVGLLVLPVQVVAQDRDTVEVVPPPTRIGPVPRFEPGPCPFERGEWAADVTLECGSLVVPERRERPSGRTLRLAVVILRGPAGGLPPLVLLHGGPGQRGIDEYLRPIATSPLPRMREVVIYDQRGAGYSEPALCPDYGRRRLHALASDRSARPAADLEADVVSACLAALRGAGIDPSAYTTVESAADLKDLRTALGYTSWDVSGNSYGARLALAALAADSAGIRSAVLVSPIRPGDHAERIGRIQRWLDRVFAGCAADAACRASFPNPAGDLAAVFEALEAEPQTISLPDAARGEVEIVLDGAKLVHGLAQAAYSPGRTERIPFLLHELRTGDRARAEREVAAWVGTQGNSPATVSLVHCNDEYVSRSVAIEDSILTVVSRPVRSVARIRSMRTCALWSTRPGEEPLQMPTESNAPVLLLAGEYDHIAPPESARWIASRLRHATVVALPAHVHDDIRPWSMCPVSITSRFWQDPTRPVDSSCTADMPPLRFVTTW
jgi:pimeloyl-ACP methyl ester carboxylesterase